MTGKIESEKTHFKKQLETPEMIDQLTELFKQTAHTSIISSSKHFSPICHKSVEQLLFSFQSLQDFEDLASSLSSFIIDFWRPICLHKRC